MASWKGDLIWQFANDTAFYFFPLKGRAVAPGSSMFGICFEEKHFEGLSMRSLK
jgi:hypothetical protein